MIGPESRRIVPLEAVRGVAAVLVVIYHGMLSFAPNAFVSATPGQALREFILGLANGGAAVTVFFVLSGFVLSMPFAPAAAGHAARRQVMIAMVKRWPRLAALTLLGCLAAWALYQISGNAYMAAASVSGSNWLASHGNAPLTSGQPLTLAAAAGDGLFRVFAFGDVRFDPALWTMRIELFCSLAIFLLAPVLFSLRRWRMRLILLAAAVAAAGAAYPATYLADFLCGLVLALLAAEGRLPKIRARGLALLSLVMLFSFGFSGAPDLRLYDPVRALLPAGDANHFVWDIGAVALMIAVLGNRRLHRALSHPWAKSLGMLSFPIYVIHVPLLLSLGAACFVVAARLAGADAAAGTAIGVTLVASLACAIPLAWADRRWRRLIADAVRLADKTRIARGSRLFAGNQDGLAGRAGQPDRLKTDNKQESDSDDDDRGVSEPGFPGWTAARPPGTVVGTQGRLETGASLRPGI